jgi:hypothetical protein
MISCLQNYRTCLRRKHEFVAHLGAELILKGLILAVEYTRSVSEVLLAFENKVNDFTEGFDDRLGGELIKILAERDFFLVGTSRPDHDGLRPAELLTARIGATDGNQVRCARRGWFRSACRLRFGFPVARKQFMEVSDLDRRKAVQDGG